MVLTFTKEQLEESSDVVWVLWLISLLQKVVVVAWEEAKMERGVGIEDRPPPLRASSAPQCILERGE